MSQLTSTLERTPWNLSVDQAKYHCPIPPHSNPHARVHTQTIPRTLYCFHPLLPIYSHVLLDVNVTLNLHTMLLVFIMNNLPFTSTYLLQLNQKIYYFIKFSKYFCFDKNSFNCTDVRKKDHKFTFYIFPFGLLEWGSSIHVPNSVLYPVLLFFPWSLHLFTVPHFSRLGTFWASFDFLAQNGRHFPGYCLGRSV